MQRNMAANCGMDYRAAGEFVASIALRELQSLEAAGVCNVTSTDADSLSGACRGVHAQAFRSDSQADKGLQTEEGILLHSIESQTGQTVQEDECHNSLRALVAAKLLLKQALPMLEGVIAEVCPVGCSSSAVGECKHSEDHSADCKEGGKHHSDVELALAPGVSSITGASTWSKNVQRWRTMDTISFWQSLQRMVFVIKACVNNSVIDGSMLRGSVTECCNGHG